MGFAVLVHDDASAEPSARASRTPWRSPFVGRAAELTYVASALADGERMISILGPPGVGKSRLAREALSRARDAGRRAIEIDGSFAEDAAELRDALLVAASKEGCSELHALARLGPAVVLVDGLDDAAGFAAEELERWLAAAPELALLAPSRVRLRCAGELVVDLGPLEPELCVEVFAGKARRAIPSFALREEERRLVAELSRRLDGLPLAVELAAESARSFAPADLLERMNVDVLLDPRGGTARSPLRDAIRSSFDRLTPAARGALTALATGPSPLTLAAAEARVRVAGVTAPAYVIEELVDASLMRVEAGEEPRYTLLESIRRFALTYGDGADRPREVQSAETGAVIARSGQWFVSPSGERVSLAASPKLAAVLAALVRARLDGRDTLDTSAIVAEGWPGELILPRAARNRVYVAVSSLRRMGLQSAVHHTRTGYRLDDDVVLAE
ncbi:MAG: AAA family ATPase [Labilithrix sp.]|nr:AAA family ATPase [Labilithrix sp.]MCW5811802.1 AAA family ATPase [Labilithrix sp.]